MKIFISVLILIFSFQSWTKADDIRDFEIEGMSIGDSLLDYFNKEYIKKKKKYFNSDKGLKKEYSSIYYYKDKLKTYDNVRIYFKSKDTNYQIQAITGYKYFKNNLEACISLKEIIVSDIKKIFSNYTVKNYPNTQLRGVKGTSDSDIFYDNVKKKISVICYNYTDDKYRDRLSVLIQSEDFKDFQKNRAFK